MTDREMLLMAYGAIKAASRLNLKLQEVAEVIANHIWLDTTPIEQLEKKIGVVKIIRSTPDD